MPGGRGVEGGRVAAGASADDHEIELLGRGDHLSLVWTGGQGSAAAQRPVLVRRRPGRGATAAARPPWLKLRVAVPSRDGNAHVAGRCRRRRSSGTGSGQRRRRWQPGDGPLEVAADEEREARQRHRRSRRPARPGARSPASASPRRGRCSTTWTCTPPTVADWPSSSTSTVRPLRSEIRKSWMPPATRIARPHSERDGDQLPGAHGAGGYGQRRAPGSRARAPGRPRSMRPSAPGRIPGDGSARHRQAAPGLGRRARQRPPAGTLRRQGAPPIEGLPLRAPVRVGGEVTRMRITPRSGTPGARGRRLRTARAT